MEQFKRNLELKTKFKEELIQQYEQEEDSNKQLEKHYQQGIKECEQDIQMT